MSDWGIPPDHVVNDGVFALSDLWHLPKAVWEPIWQRATGKSIKIAILDTGIVDHPDLPKPIAAKSFIRGESVTDRNGHGAHCAGTALGRNGIGVAPEAELIVGKVLSNGGSGSSDGIADGILWATDEGADIISMSLGGGSSYGPTNRVIDRAFSQGAIVNAAAGNSGFAGGRNTIGWPAKYAGCLCNGATRRDGNIANFSSGGNELDWATPGQDIISASIRGGLVSMSGTCLEAGSLVYTPRGPVKIEDITPGQEVFAWKDGRVVVRPAVAMLNQGKADTITVNASGRKLRCTPEHRFLAVTKNMEPEWVEAQHLTSEHRLVTPEALPTEVDEAAIVSPDLAWLAGFFLGDGWISNGNNNNYQVCFSWKNRPNVTQRLQATFERTFGKSLTFAKNGKWYYVYSKQIWSLFDALDLNHRSQDKHIPSWVWCHPGLVQDAFFQGYLDSDGYAKARGQGYECTSKVLLEHLAAWHDYKGFKRGAIGERKRVVQPPNSPEPVDSHTYTLTATWGSMRQAGTAFFRKKQSGSLLLEAGLEGFTFSKPVVRHDVENVQVYDITVPDADCFIANGLIVHNSMATPMGSGLLALIVQLQRQAGATEWTAVNAVREFFKQWCEDRGDTGHDPRFGWGVPRYEDIIKALQYDEITWI